MRPVGQTLNRPQRAGTTAPLVWLDLTCAGPAAVRRGWLLFLVVRHAVASQSARLGCADRSRGRDALGAVVACPGRAGADEEARLCRSADDLIWTLERLFDNIGRVPVSIELPAEWGPARLVMCELAKLGYTWTEFRLLGRALLELH